MGLLKFIINLFKTEEEKFLDKCKESKRFSREQINQIEKGVCDGLVFNRIIIYANPVYNENQMLEIRQGLKSNLSIDKVKFYANPKFTAEQMYRIREMFCDGFSLEQIEICIDDKFSYEQQEEIKKGFKSNLSIDKVKFYANPSFSIGKMIKIRLGLKDGFDIKEISLYVDNEFDNEQEKEIKKGLKNLSIDKVKFYANPKFSAKLMRFIRLGLSQGFTIDELSHICKEINNEQISEIIKGFVSNLSIDEVKFYANPNFSVNQMRDIRVAFRSGFKKDEILKYSKSDKGFDELHKKLELSEELIDFLSSNVKFETSEFIENYYHYIITSFSSEQIKKILDLKKYYSRLGFLDILEKIKTN